MATVKREWEVGIVFVSAINTLFEISTWQLVVIVRLRSGSSIVSVVYSPVEKAEIPLVAGQLSAVMNEVKMRLA